MYLRDRSLRTVLRYIKQADDDYPFVKSSYFHESGMIRAYEKLNCLHNYLSLETTVSNQIASN